MICDKYSDLLPEWNPDDENACVVNYCMQLMDIARKETNGQCVFSREGIWQIYEIIKNVTVGNAQSDDYELLLDVLTQIEEGASCQLAIEAAGRCIRLMKEYEEEWEKHLLRKRCANLVCRCSYTLYIDPQLCDGCSECLTNCPAGTIIGGSGMIHIIQAEAGSMNRLTEKVCPKGAIKRAGAIKPKLPSEPIPVGSFSDENSAGAGAARRRRRRG